MLIYAHRGASWNSPELTEAAYLAAVEEGADGFECDLRLSKDEVPVLWHNPTMQEQTGNPGLIAEMNYSDIAAIYPEVLTLDQFLDIALHLKKHVLLETKHPVISGNRIEEVVSQTIRDRQVLDEINVSVMSFSWGAIEKLHRIDSEIPTTFLYGGKNLWMQAKYSSASMIAPGLNQVRSKPEIIAKIKAMGKKSAVWTVDSGADIEMVRDLGVDILITNMPARARTFL